MATVDYSIGATSTVTITNNAVAKKVYDAGSLQHAKPSEIQHDENGDYVMDDATRKVQLYRVNTFVKLPAGDSLKLGVDASEEVAYYMNLASDELSVVVETATAGE